MNKLLPLLFLVNFSYQLKSQAYVPFPTSNASWIDNAGRCLETHYRVEGDTVVNGLLYHKLWYYELDASQNAPPGMTCGHILGATISKGYHGAFRNDSINKKVFYLRRSLNQEQLLYDFNLNIGDTLESNSIKFSTDSSREPPLIVIRVDSIQLGGVSRKRFTFNSCDLPFSGCSNSTDTLRLIEGIGSTQNFLGHYYFTEVHLYPTPRLYCYRSNSQVLYSDGRFGHCQLLTEIQKVAVNDLLKQISPNPTKGMVNIPYVEGLEGVEVLNMPFVRLSFERSENGRSLDKTTIDLSNYPSGTYILRLQMQNGEVFTKKVIKE